MRNALRAPGAKHITRTEHSMPAYVWKRMLSVCIVYCSVHCTLANTHKCDIDERFSLFAFAQHQPYTAHNYGAAARYKCNGSKYLGDSCRIFIELTTDNILGVCLTDRMMLSCVRFYAFIKFDVEREMRNAAVR